MRRRGSYSRICGHVDARPALNGARTGTAHAQDTTSRATIARTRMAKTRTRTRNAVKQTQINASRVQIPSQPRPSNQNSFRRNRPQRKAWHRPLQDPTCTGPGPVQVHRSDEQGSQKEGSQPLHQLHNPTDM